MEQRWEKDQYFIAIENRIDNNSTPAAVVTTNLESGVPENIPPSASHSDPMAIIGLATAVGSWAKTQGFSKA
ncbi:hypothetical protein [Pelagibaculum spongiae]|uniref:Uncharacterized protein n=1 Tax=Pelagibaculum spongiae TaxID=2080658 RepID=A0A2V1GP80_9GAMM|nr:hypothetical protein [Pelagibaculum spongiae]PVZ64327.1 hypothetical protein DC094_19885 [Pelagibaculum spongiae]